MHYVVVPADVTVTNKRTGEVVKYADGDERKDLVVTMPFFFEQYIVNSSELTKGVTTGEGLRRIMKLTALFEDAKAGDVIGVEDADFKAVRKAVDAIQFPPAFQLYASQMLPFVQAWEDAEKQNEEWKKARDKESDGKISPLRAG